MRGHTPSYEHLMDDVAQLLSEANQRFPDRPRFIYGHSMGGNLALNYVLRRRPQLLLKELVDCFLRLPHIDDSPTPLYRTCYVKDSPLSCLAAESVDEMAQPSTGGRLCRYRLARDD